MQRLSLSDFLVIAEAVTGISALRLARVDRVVIAAESALAAPWAGFGEVELFPGLETKAAIYASRILRHHPLIDGNKRTAFIAMIEFVERNGRVWVEPPGGQDEQAEMIEGLAAGSVREENFIEWVRQRIE